MPGFAGPLDLYEKCNVIIKTWDREFPGNLPVFL